MSTVSVLFRVNAISRTAKTRHGAYRRSFANQIKLNQIKPGTTAGSLNGS